MADKILVLICLISLFSAGYLFGREINYCTFCHRPHHLSYKSCESCHRGISITKRKEIAHYRLIYGDFAHFRLEGSEVLKKAYEIIEKSGCRRCHVILGEGNNLATSLDNLPVNIEVKELIKNIKNPPEFMPYFSFSNNDLKLIINGILRGIFVYKKEKQEFLFVHFRGSKKQDNFTKHCGNCHKVISKRYGPLGKGHWGPNLSGLFTRYYQTEKGVWNREKLYKWVNNPRELDKNSLMPPVPLKTKEFERIVETLFDS